MPGQYCKPEDEALSEMQGQVTIAVRSLGCEAENVLSLMQGLVHRLDPVLNPHPMRQPCDPEADKIAEDTAPLAAELVEIHGAMRKIRSIIEDINEALEL